jgi:hypothetical protein
LNYPLKKTDLNIYHLKMITKERRSARRDLYNALDPKLAFQAIGYGYLADDDGAVLERIPSIAATGRPIGMMADSGCRIPAPWSRRLETVRLAYKASMDLPRCSNIIRPRTSKSIRAR